MNKKLILLTGVLLQLVCSIALATEKLGTGTSVISFDNLDYGYQWSNDDLHEFTPEGQSVTGDWKDMLTLSHYTDISNAIELAEATQDILAHYEEAGGIVLGLESIEPVDNQASEYILAVVFGADEVAEFAFVRFRLQEGMGMSIAYAHRAYGEDAHKQINGWMKTHGSRLKQKIIALNDIPAYSEFQKNGTYELMSSFKHAI